jgi:eukaryotic-like serine/threonine-protein kinase
MPTLDVFPGARDPTPITTVESRAAAERAAAALRGTGSGPAVQEAGTGSVSRSHGTLVAANISQVPPPGGPTARTLLVALAVVAVAVAGALVAVLVVKSPPSPQVATTAAPADTAPDPDKITLSITYGPPGAIAKLDGVPLAQNPFVAHTRRDGSMHRLDVEGAGLKPDTRMVSYEKDVNVSVSLQAAEAPPPADSASAAATTAEPAKHPGGPGSDRPKPLKPARGIDEKDPYKQ